MWFDMHVCWTLTLCVITAQGGAFESVGQNARAKANYIRPGASCRGMPSVGQ